MEFSVGAAISLNLDSFAILNRVFKNHFFFTFFYFFKIKYLDFSVDIIWKLVWASLS